MINIMKPMKNEYSSQFTIFETPNIDINHSSDKIFNDKKHSLNTKKKKTNKKK